MTIDPRLPGFEDLWDAERMADVLTRLLPTRPGWNLSGLSLQRIRHRLGKRGIVHYTAAYSSESESLDVLIVAMVRMDRDPQAVMRKILAGSTIDPPPPLSSVVACDTQTNLLLLVFPVDRRLPGLQLLGTPSGRHLLASLAGCAETPEPGFVTVRHRLGLGATVRLLGGGQDMYLKFRPAGEAQPATRLGAAMHERLPNSLHCALPQLVSEEHDITATSTIAGKGTDQIVGDLLTGWLSVVALALADLHSIPGEGLPVRGEVAHNRADRAEAWLRAILGPTEALFRELRATGSEIGSGSQFIHGDLKPEHVLERDGEVGLLDLDSAGRGRPLADIASLSVRLPADSAPHFLHEYRECASTLPWHEFGAEWALASMKYALSQGQQHAPGWEAAVTSTLESGLSSPLSG